MLAPVYRDAAGELRLVVVRRSDRGVYGGHLAFPGGKQSKDDADLLETALRETEEEIGAAREDVELVAALEPVIASATLYHVQPYVARLREPGKLRPCEREIVEILHVPLSRLTAPGACYTTTKEFALWPEPREVPCYRIGEHELWGLTYRILNPLLPRLQADEWRI